MPRMTGLASMVCASGLAAAAAACFFLAFQWEPEVSSLSGTYIRVWMNGLLLVFFFSTGYRVNGLNRSQVRWLLLWGALGALTVATYFAAVKSVGAGTASVLNSSFGIFAIAFSPRQKGQKVPWVLLLAASAGLWFMLPSDVLLRENLGLVAGIASGLFAGLAYLSVSRLGITQSPVTVLLFWTVVCLPVTTIWILLADPTWPQTYSAWILLLIAGLLAAGSQYFIGAAYLKGPVDEVSAFSYLAPGVSVGLDVVLFHKVFSAKEFVGTALILLAGSFSRISKLRLSRRLEGAPASD
jgi:drug/metabolite transporter (DMT)-like permease